MGIKELIPISLDGYLFQCPYDVPASSEPLEKEKKNEEIRYYRVSSSFLKFPRVCFIVNFNTEMKINSVYH